MKINRRHLIGASFIICHLSFSAAFLSCSSMLETDSEIVEYEKDNTLNHLTDSVYSSLGIINKMQIIADRTVLLGEVRGDLVETTDMASADLKRLSAFNLKEKNKYNAVSDYYAVINNCNYFLAHADTAMKRRGVQVLLPEYAAAKAFRAWTYLQLALNYEKVPLVLTPLMTEQEARNAMNQTPVDIAGICDYFINDLAPYAHIEKPDFGRIYNEDSKDFFIPMRALLGDLCLWAGRYTEAAKWYHDFLNDSKNPVQLISLRSVWDPTNLTYTSPTLNYYVSSSDFLCFIPMESRSFDGVVSDLRNVFGSTEDNKYYFQLTPSEGMRQISAAQEYCTEYKKSTQTDTLYAPRTGLNSDLWIGDLRLASNNYISSLGGKSAYSEYNSIYQTCEKVFRLYVPLYRGTMVYLRFAEALNRAGLPQSAMLILKHGMCNDNVKLYVDATEQAKAGTLIDFDPSIFKRLDDAGNRAIYGIHSFGSGDSHVNQKYVLPQPPTALATYQDTVDWQIPEVENMIITEMALEGAFEGNRFYDLMRVALRRNDPAYLAKPLSVRNSTTPDAALYTLLMDKSNWYLPLQPQQ